MYEWVVREDGARSVRIHYLHACLHSWPPVDMAAAAASAFDVMRCQAWASAA